MQIEYLRTFLEIYRTRHFGRAASKLHVTQAAVSSRLKTMETQLGVQLFERNSGEIRLTGPGKRLLPHAEKMTAIWRNAKQDVASLTDTEQLVIGGSVRVWDIVVQDWLHKLRANFPAMAIIAESKSSEFLTRELLDGTLDVAIVLEPAQLASLSISEIGQLELNLVSTFPDLSPSEALEKHFIDVDWGISFALEKSRHYPDAPEAMTKVSQASIALHYMLNFGGSAYLPATIAKPWLDKKVLHKVRGAETFKRRVFAIQLTEGDKWNLIDSCLKLFDQKKRDT